MTILLWTPLHPSYSSSGEPGAHLPDDTHPGSSSTHSDSMDLALHKAMLLINADDVPKSSEWVGNLSFILLMNSYLLIRRPMRWVLNNLYRMDHQQMRDTAEPNFVPLSITWSRKFVKVKTIYSGSRAAKIVEGLGMPST